MDRPSKVYLEEPVTISGIVIHHTMAGLVYLIDHYKHILAMTSDAKLKPEDRQHLEKLLENYAIHLQVYDRSLEHAYKMGFDCAVNGSNETNCDFRIFGSAETMKAWENGKADAMKKDKLC